MSSGIAPARAWAIAAEHSAFARAPVRSAVAEALSTGESEAIARAMRGGWSVDPPAYSAPELARARAQVGAVWAVAIETGSPLASALNGIASSLRERAGRLREADVAVTAPRATVRLVSVLPLIGIACGQLLGFPVLATLLGTPIGWALLALGGALMAVAVLWSRRILARALRPEPRVDTLLDLTAIALSGGVAAGEACARAARALGLVGLAETEEARAARDRILRISREAGIPAAGLLREEAARVRREQALAAAQRLEAAGVALMLPLGLAALPAYLCVGVIPLVLSMVGPLLA